MRLSTIFTHYCAWVNLLCIQGLVVLAFNTAYTTLRSRNFRDNSAHKFSATNTNAVLELGDEIDINAASSERKFLILQEVDKLLPNNPMVTEDILAKISCYVAKDVQWTKESPLPFESGRNHYGVKPNQLAVEYEPVTVGIASSEASVSTIALRTKPSTPLLSPNEIAFLREAVETYWRHMASTENDGDSSSKSRFTYQRRGNSEAHLSDVVQYYEQMKKGEKEQLQLSALVEKLLLDRVYPWIRDAFLSEEDESIYSDDLSLYVYDSLFIRYNATEAEKIGAGQPLHRDLGYVSINLMLNSQDDFDGGGTFFENQLTPVVMNGGVGASNNDIHPLKPHSPGHAIAHYSSSRHAGAATFEGVRDILVLFVAAATDGTPPKWEVAARLKSAARVYCSDVNSIDEQLICRVRHHRLALEQMPEDGEAYHYLGMALLDYHQYYLDAQGCRNDSLLTLAISCLEEATTHTPCDGRLQNNLGLARERLVECLESDNAENESMIADLRGQVVAAFKRSIQIHSLSKQLGCDVNVDYESACLNYGLYLSKLDDFQSAIRILSDVASNYDEVEDMTSSENSEDARRRVQRDASNLLSFCEMQIQ